jgi:hypothetical protein
MKIRSSTTRSGGLLAGDMVALALERWLALPSHGELTTAGMRLFTTLVPLVAAWLLAASNLGKFERSRAADWRQLWRVL